MNKNEVIDDPQKLSNIFNVFFKTKVEHLAEKLVKDPSVDPLSKLKDKVKGLELNFSLKTISEKQVWNVVRKLKNKRSAGFDGISAELIKLGGEMLIAPLTFIINSKKLLYFILLTTNIEKFTSKQHSELN